MIARVSVALGTVVALLCLSTGCGADKVATPVVVGPPSTEVPIYSPSRVPGSPRSAKETRPELSFTSVEFCRHVWKVGKTLLRDYEGCFENDGNTVVDATMKRSCGTYFETEVHQTYGEEFWGALGGRIHDDPGAAVRFAAQHEVCSG